MFKFSLEKFYYYLDFMEIGNFLKDVNKYYRNAVILNLQIIRLNKETTNGSFNIRDIQGRSDISDFFKKGFSKLS